MFVIAISGLAYGLICDRPVKVQMVQVQDGTSSFEDDIRYMKEVMDEVTHHIAEEYGVFEFGLATFTDKPQIITGWGKNEGVWKSFDEGSYRADYCYERKSTLGEEVDLSNVRFGGGKDTHENQLDALVMAAIDPDMGWSEADTDEEGNVVIRLAVLVTDGGAHRKSDVDLEKRNWYHEELMGGPCDYMDESCSAWHGNTSSRTGVTLSLEGTLSHYDHFMVKSDSEMLTAGEYWGWEHYEEFTKYRYCCTEAYGRFPYVYHSDCSNFETWEQCSRISCEYCKGGMCDKYCSNEEKSVSWFGDIKREKFPVKPYVYGDDRLKDVDCSTMEYPDPFSAEYADMFKKYNITPLFFIRMPAKEPRLGENTWPFGIDDMYMANNSCPKVGERLARYWLCYADPSRRREGGITSTGVCDDYDPAELRLSEFYKECLDEHYGDVVSSLVRNGVSSSYVIVDSDSTNVQFLDDLSNFIKLGVASHQRCEKKDPTSFPATEKMVTSTGAVKTGGSAVRTDSDGYFGDDDYVREDDYTDDEYSTRSDNNVKGIIAGVTVGTAAAAGVAGGVRAYMSSIGSTITDTHIENDAINQNMAEREQVTHVDADMFL